MFSPRLRTTSCLDDSDGFTQSPESNSTIHELDYWEAREIFDSALEKRMAGRGCVLAFRIHIQQSFLHVFQVAYAVFADRVTIQQSSQRQRLSLPSDA
jgi:hypothetical protein